MDMVSAARLMRLLALTFMDIAPFAEQVGTLALPRLSDRGGRFSFPHTAASCALARGMLLTGVDSYRNGVPNLINSLPPE